MEFELIEAMRQHSLDNLVHTAEHDPDHHRREAVTYHLAVTFSKEDGDHLLPALLAILAREDEAPGVIAQAAEGVGSHLELSDRRRRVFRQATALLLQRLDHPEAEVRFWACYALGVMQATAALPDLDRLAQTDDALIPRWWRVCDEAADAVTCIRTGRWPHRER